MIFNNYEQKKVIQRYSNKYSKYGYSEKTLGWDKGKQDIRFDILTSKWDFKDKTILDIGCGFGDLYKFLNTKFNKISYYHGLDIVPNLIKEGKKIYTSNNCKLEVNNFLDWEPNRKYDFIIVSGLFNFKINGEGNNYKFIESILQKSFYIANIGVATNFLSTKVDYQKENTFHSNPSKILDIGLSLTRNTLLRHDYFPFEFSLFLDKRESFNHKNTIFNSYKG